MSARRTATPEAARLERVEYQRGGLRRMIDVEHGATVGAVVGRDLRDADGQIIHDLGAFIGQSLVARDTRAINGVPVEEILTPDGTLIVKQIQAEAIRAGDLLENVRLTSGKLLAEAGGNTLALGPDLGTAADLVAYFGPSPAAGDPAAIDKALAVFWLDEAGNAHFGGTLSVARVTERLAGNGGNLLWEEYSHFRSGMRPPLTGNGAVLAVTAAAGTKGGYRLACTTSAGADELYFGSSATDYNLPLEPGDYLVSFTAHCSVAGHAIRPALCTQDGLVQAGDAVALTAAAARYVVRITTGAATTAGVLRFALDEAGVAGRVIYLDGLMIERAVGAETVASQWVPGPSARETQRALQPGQNLLTNPSGQFAFAGWAGGWIGGSQQNMVTRLETFGFAFACHSTSVATSYDQGVSQIFDAAVSGAVLTLSAGMYAAHQATGTHIIELRFQNSSGVEIDGTNRPTIGATIGLNELRRYSTTVTAPVGTAKIQIILRQTGTFTATGVFNRWWGIKLEVGSVATPFADDATFKVSPDDVHKQPVAGGYAGRIGLRVAGSGHRIGDQRNAPQSLVSAYGAVRTATALTASSTGAVSVNAFTFRYGGSSVPYTAVANAVTGLTVGATYVIYCFDDAFVGGARTWLAGTSRDAVMNLGDGIVVAGEVTIPASGTSGGGGGGGFEDCVLADQLVLERARGWIEAGAVRGGDWLRVWDDNPQAPGGAWEQVESNHLAHAPSTRIHTARAEVAASDSTPMPTRDGRLVLLPQAEEVLERTAAGVAWAPVLARTPIGERLVAHIRVRQRCYFAGARPDATIATHNPTYKP